jgi:orotate phosphoribosyltransferase-like protein
MNKTCIHGKKCISSLKCFFLLIDLFIFWHKLGSSMRQLQRLIPRALCDLNRRQTVVKVLILLHAQIND